MSEYMQNDKIKQEKLKETLLKLKQIELHFQRKENQLFPKLEKEGFTGPSKVMWGKHDEIRNQFKTIEKALENSDYKEIKDTGTKLISMIKNIIFMEEKILYPTSLRKLTEENWIEIRKEESEIGYAWIKPGNLWDINIARSKQKKEKDVAEFWLTLNDRFIHIRYFALYDDNRNYKGVIEVSQDTTDIRALEGERRLLDW